MGENNIRKILEKQMQLVSERSAAAQGALMSDDLVALTKALCQLADTINQLFPNSVAGP